MTLEKIKRSIFLRLKIYLRLPVFLIYVKDQVSLDRNIKCICRGLFNIAVTSITRNINS